MNTQQTKISLGIVISFLLTACSGSGSDIISGIGGSGKVASGSITGFGSVFVNGVEFETDSAMFDIDGIPGTQDDLAIGMIVNVSGIINADGLTGTASKIEFNEQVEGPVSSLSAPNADGTTRSFTVLGTNVIINSTSTVFDVSGILPANTPFDFDSIANNNNVEISGFFDSSNNLLATRVELKELSFTASSLVEIKGNITALSGNTFTLNGLTVDASSAVLDDLPNGLVNGVLVEVKGNFDSASNTLTATKVEAEDNDFDDADEFEIEGLITNYVNDGNFKINGIQVNASNALKEPSTLILENDIRVEVEGAISNETLIAAEIKAREGSVEIKAPVSSVNPATNSFTVKPVATQPAITITITSSTQLEDDVNEIEPFSLNNLVTNVDFVEVEGFINGNGDIVATEVKVKESDDIEVQGTIESGASIGTVKVLGVEFSINGSTSFENANDVDIDQTTFFNSISFDSTLIKVKDQETADGIADEVEIETD